MADFSGRSILGEHAGRGIRLDARREAEASFRHRYNGVG